MKPRIATIRLLLVLLAPVSAGTNLSAVLRDPSQPGRADLVFAYRKVQRAVATKDWKLIWYPNVQRTQLFNL